MSAEQARAAFQQRYAKDLAAKLGYVLPEANRVLPVTAGEALLIHGFREYVSPHAALPPAALLTLRDQLMVAAADFLVHDRDGPALFANVGRTPSGLVRRIFDAVDAHPELFRNLPRRNPQPGTGREGGFNGLIFEDLAIHHVGLHQDLRAAAVSVVGELNQLLRTSPGQLIDLDGISPGVTVPFGVPVKGIDFWLSRPVPKDDFRSLAELLSAGPETFVWERYQDCGYMAQGGGFWAAPIGVEIKRPGVAARANAQLGTSLDRLAASEMMRMRLPGATEFTLIPTRAIAFAPGNRQLVAVTRSLSGGADYSFRAATQGTFEDHLLRVDLELDVGPIDRLLGLFYRARLR